jgi:hypothetical protein
MRQVADQKFETPIPGLGRGNEIGLLAGALEVTTGLERQRLTDHELQQAQRETREAMDQVSNTIAEISAIMSGIEVDTAQQRNATQDFSRSV